MWVVFKHIFETDEGELVTKVHFLNKENIAGGRYGTFEDENGNRTTGLELEPSDHGEPFLATELHECKTIEEVAEQMKIYEGEIILNENILKGE